MDSGGWIGLIWLTIGVGLLLSTIVSRPGKTDPDREPSGEPGSPFSFWRPIIPFTFILSGSGMTPWGMEIFGADPTDDRCSTGP